MSFSSYSFGMNLFRIFFMMYFSGCIVVPKTKHEILLIPGPLNRKTLLLEDTSFVVRHTCTKTKVEN